eukprot:1161913-Pelagomonas_calceolata.AAC.16
MDTFVTINRCRGGVGMRLAIVAFGRGSKGVIASMIASVKSSVMQKEEHVSSPPKSPDAGCQSVQEPTHDSKC